MYIRLIVLAFVALFPICANAGGTLYLEDIKPLLKQQPELWSAVTAGFNLSEVGMASRINSKINEKLSGVRIAPYTFNANPKGAANDSFMFIVEIRAKTRYVDANGKDVPIGDAAKVVETLKSIVIRPVD